MMRLWFALVLLIPLAACAEYKPSTAKCFASFAETARANCTFEQLTPLDPAYD